MMRISPLFRLNSLPAATFTREPIAPRTAEERQGLKKLAAELRELLSLLEKENQNRAK